MGHLKIPNTCTPLADKIFRSAIPKYHGVVVVEVTAIPNSIHVVLPYQSTEIRSEVFLNLLIHNPDNGYLHNCHHLCMLAEHQ